MSVARIRSVKQAVEEIQSVDRNSPITEKMLRRLILSEAVPSVRIGRRYYINMDILTEYLTKGIDTSKNFIEDYGKIRPLRAVK